MASGGYPDAYRTGYPIDGLDAANARPNTVVFHAGTARDGERIVTKGGRVLGVTALGQDIRNAIARTYAAVEDIAYRDAYYRRDIGHRALARLGDQERR
jgi:phosphoribosylamine--glycine ligase